jgi:hypothetical protein
VHIEPRPPQVYGQDIQLGIQRAELVADQPVQGDVSLPALLLNRAQPQVYRRLECGQPTADSIQLGQHGLFQRQLVGRIACRRLLVSRLVRHHGTSSPFFRASPGEVFKVLDARQLRQIAQPEL